MKKLISLLLAVMLVMSMMTFSVSASTDTEITPVTAEEDLELGYFLAPEKNPSVGFFSPHPISSRCLQNTLSSFTRHHRAFYSSHFMSSS